MTRLPSRLPAAALPAAAVQTAAEEPEGLVTDVESFVDLVLDTAFRLLPKLLLAAAILLVFVGLAYVVRVLLRRLFEKTHLEQDVAGILLALARYVIVGFGVMLALDNLGLNVTSIIAGLGIAGIALGFAAKDTLANFIAGITIMWDRPFRVGDRIEVEGSVGIVRKVTLRTTRLDTVRNEVVIFPNETMVTQKIVNHTMRPSLRVDVPFGIAYEADIEKAREVALATAAGDEAIRPKPEPAVVVSELAASSVNLELRIWLKDPLQELSTRLRYTERIKNALDGAGIEMPFPQLTVHVADVPEPAAGGRLDGGGAPGEGPRDASAEKVLGEAAGDESPARKTASDGTTSPPAAV